MMNKKKFCIICGRLMKKEQKCENCLAVQSEWEFLKQLEKQDTEIKLQCIFISDVKSWTRCDGEFLIHTSALKQTIGVSGNGPYGHLLTGRDDLSGRCKKCGKFAYSVQLVQRNKERLVDVYNTIVNN